MNVYLNINYKIPNLYKTYRAVNYVSTQNKISSFRTPRPDPFRRPTLRRMWKVFFVWFYKPFSLNIKRRLCCNIFFNCEAHYVHGEQYVFVSRHWSSDVCQCLFNVFNYGACILTRMCRNRRRSIDRNRLRTWSFNVSVSNSHAHDSITRFVSVSNYIS